MSFRKRHLDQHAAEETARVVEIEALRAEFAAEVARLRTEIAKRDKVDDLTAKVLHDRADGPMERLEALAARLTDLEAGHEALSDAHSETWRAAHDRISGIDRELAKIMTRLADLEARPAAVSRKAAASRKPAEPKAASGA